MFINIVKPVSPQRDVALVEVTVRRNQDTVLRGVSSCNCMASRPRTPLFSELLCGNFKACMLHFPEQLLQKFSAGLC
jgi:hypothetical protein